MADDQDVVVELEGTEGVGAGDTGGQEKKPGGEAAVKTESAGGDVSDPMADLKRQFEELRRKDEARAKALEGARARENAERVRADQAVSEAQDARAQAAGTELNAVTTALAAAKGEADAAEREYQAAFEAGDSKRVAEAQRRLSRAEAQQVALDRDKQFLEARNAQQQGEAGGGRVARAPSQEAQDAAWMARQPVHIREWLQDHPDVMTEPEMRHKAAAADAAARKAGHNPNSDEYLPFVEDYLYGAQGHEGGAQQQRGRQMDRRSGGVGTARQRMTGAPPSRGGASASGGGGPLSMTLTAREAASAQDGTIVWNTGKDKGKPIGVKEMARRKAILTQEGAYDRIYRS